MLCGCQKIESCHETEVMAGIWVLEGCEYLQGSFHSVHGGLFLRLSNSFKSHFLKECIVKLLTVSKPVEGLSLWKDICAFSTFSNTSSDLGFWVTISAWLKQVLTAFLPQGWFYNAPDGPYSPLG